MKLVKGLIRFYIKLLPIKINSGWFFMNPGNIELISVMLKGQYEIESTQLFNKIIKPGWTVVDAGAYIGYYTTHFAKLVGSESKVIAFEPEPINRSLLKRNLALHRVKNVVLNPVALGNRRGVAKLYIDAPNTSLVKRNVHVKDEVEVKVETLDSIIGGKKVDFIKMDIQGYEFKALKGAEKTLDSNRDIILHLEMWSQGLRNAGDSPLELLDFLRNKKFKIYTVKNKMDYSKHIWRLVEMADKALGGSIDIICSRH